MSQLSADNLYALDDAQVLTQVQNVFLAQLECSGSVNADFFAGAAGPALGAANPGWVDQVATALVCSSIARSSLFGFSACINLGAADSFWQSQLASSSSAAIQAGQTLYNWAFPAWCQSGGISFQQYLNSNPAAWAAQFASHVTSPSFINTEIAKLLGSDPDWLRKLNLVFYKIGRLDATQVQPVVNAWTNAFPNKGITVQWQNYNFVPANLFQPDQFLGQVNSAISVKITRTSPMARGITRITAIYGQHVNTFLQGTPHAMGLTTGQSPNNTKDETWGGGGCFVAGTPVTLADGKTLPIEQVGSSHHVLAQHGYPSPHSIEDVVIRTDRPVALFGINDLAPFFTAGHLFWTQDGWKAVEPDVAEEENPGRCVGRLQPGDRVYRLREADPPAYDEIVITDLPSASCEPGTDLHGLHLEGEPSYHAHGFLVAMNYPVITAERLTTAFARLTPHERALLARTFEPLFPLLNQALGPFVEQPLRQAMR